MDQQVAQQKFLHMQQALENQTVVIDNNNIHIVVRGDQLFEEITLDGQLQPQLVEALNNAISQTKQIAKEAMIKYVAQ